MPSKEFELEDGIKLLVSKRRNNRNIKLTIDGLSRRVKVSQPYWVPYSTGLQFAKSKQDWIRQQLPPEIHFESGQLIGKNHRLEIIEQATNANTKLTSTAICIYVNLSLNDSAKQKYITKEISKHAPKALKDESIKLIPQRVAHLSSQTGLVYNDLRFKKLKGRWGSCDQKKNITLNIFLIQLPWQLIDYVILHELVHTKHLHHQKDFWDETVKFMPNAKQRRKQMKNFKPQVFGA